MLAPAGLKIHVQLLVSPLHTWIPNHRLKMSSQREAKAVTEPTVFTPILPPAMPPHTHSSQPRA